MADETRKQKAEVFPVYFNGAKVGNASTDDKAIEIIEKLVIAFFNPGASGVMGKLTAWNKLANSFGYDAFGDDVMAGGWNPEAKNYEFIVEHRS